jgi:hypothetical protein
VQAEMAKWSSSSTQQIQFDQVDTGLVEALSHSSI